MKRKLLLWTFLLILGSFCVPIYASDNSPSTQQVIAEFTQNNIVPYSSDIIQYKFRRTSSGQLQYRRWNETKQKWVDPYWINVN